MTKEAQKKAIGSLDDIEKITATLLNKQKVILKPPNAWTITVMKARFDNLEEKLQDMFSNHLENLHDLLWVSWQSVENKKDFKNNLDTFISCITENEEDIQVVMESIIKLWTEVVELLNKIIKEQNIVNDNEVDAEKKSVKRKKKKS